MNIKKKILTLILLLCVFFPCLSLATGCGKEEPPPEEISWDIDGEGYYLVNKENFLKFIGMVNESVSKPSYKIIINEEEKNSENIRSAKYRLSENINLGGATITSIGVGKSGGNEHNNYNSFVGTFDGNGKKISNFNLVGSFMSMYVDSVPTIDGFDGEFDAVGGAYYGFFARVDNAKIENVWLDNYTVAIENYTPPTVIGAGLIGYAVAETSVNNCKITNCTIGYRTDNGVYWNDKRVDRRISTICGAHAVYIDEQDKNLTINNVEINNFNIVSAGIGRKNPPAFKFDLESPNYDMNEVDVVKAFVPAAGELTSIVKNCVGQNIKFKYNYSDNTGSGVKWDSSSWNNEQIANFVGNVENYQLKPNLPNGTFSYKTTLTNDYATYPWYKPAYAEGSESNFNNGYLTLQQFMDSKTVTFATITDESNNIVVDYEFMLPDGSKYDVSHSESESVDVPVYEVSLPLTGLPETLNKKDNYTSILENYQIVVKPKGRFLQNTIGCSLDLKVNDDENGVYIYKPDFDIVKTEITFKQLNTDNVIKEYSASSELQDEKYISYSVEDFVLNESAKKIYLGENIDLETFNANNEEYSTGYEVEKYDGNNLSAGNNELKLIVNVYKLTFNPETGELNLERDSDVKYTIPAGMILERTYKTVNVTSEKLDIVIAPKLLEDDSDPNPDGTIDVSVEVYINKKTAPHTRFNSSSFKSNIAIGDKFIFQSSELFNFFRITSPEDDEELTINNSSYVTGTLGNVNGYIEIVRTYKNNNSETETIISLTDNKFEELIKTKTVIKIYVTTEFEIPEPPEPTIITSLKIKVKSVEVNGEKVTRFITNGTGTAVIEAVEDELIIEASSISIENALNITNKSVAFTISGTFTTYPYNRYDSIIVTYTQGEMYQLSIDYSPISIDDDIVVVNPTFEVKSCTIDYRPARLFNTMEVSNIDPENVMLSAGGTITFEDIKSKYPHLYNANSGMVLKGYSIKPVDSKWDEIEYTNQYVINGAKYGENELLTEFTSITNIISNIAITPVYENAYYKVTVKYQGSVVDEEGNPVEVNLELRVKHGGMFNPVAENHNTAVSLMTKTAEGVVVDSTNVYAYIDSLYSHYEILTENAQCIPVDQNTDGKYRNGLNSITGNITIKLIFVLKTHTITFVSVEGSSQEEKEINVVQGANISVEESSDASYVKFIVNGETITYNALTGYKYRLYSAIGECDISEDGKEIVVNSDLEIRPLFIAEAGLITMELITGIDDEDDSSYQKLTVLDGTEITFGYEKTGTTATDIKEKFIINITDNAPMTYTTKNGQVGSGTDAGNERWIFEKAVVEVGSTKYYFEVKDGKLYYGLSESVIDTEVTENSLLITINTTDTTKTIVDYVRVQVYFKRVYDITFSKEALIEESTGTYVSIKDIVSVNSCYSDFTDTGSSWNINLDTADYGVNLTRSYEYTPGNTSELDIKINLIGQSLIKYTVARYYTIVGLKVDIDEDSNKTNISITNKFDFNRGRNFVITPIVKFNAVKLNLGYDITDAKILYQYKPGNKTTTYLNSKDKYEKDTYNWDNTSIEKNLTQVNYGTGTGNKATWYKLLKTENYTDFCKGDIFLEYGSKITYGIGEIEVKGSQDPNNLADGKYNFYTITVEEAETSKVIKIAFISKLTLQQLSDTSSMKQDGDKYEVTYDKDTYDTSQYPEVKFTFGAITSG